MGPLSLGYLLVAVLVLNVEADGWVMPHHSIGPIVPSGPLRCVAMLVPFSLEVLDELSWRMRDINPILTIFFHVSLIEFVASST